MERIQEMMKAYDKETTHILKTQLLHEGDPRFGGYVKAGYHVDSREHGFCMAHIMICYICNESQYYLSDQVKHSLQAALIYMQNNLRPSGCVDLTECNFASAPDTAFTANELISAWWLLEKRMCPELEWLHAPLKALLVRLAQGVAKGGFHTPNHRWAIAACLKCVAQIAHRPDFNERADEYLNEGIDINEYGEYAERSAGTYNQVNDDQMVRLYMATGDKTYLEHVRKNLRMIISYIDPDDTVFTNNSTRQDQGKKIYLDSYYIWFLLAGYFLHDEELSAMAEYCYTSSFSDRRTNKVPAGLPWLLLIDGLEQSSVGARINTDALLHYQHHFPDSGIARMRNNNISLTVMQAKPNFLYVQIGAMPMYMVIHSQICANCNFLPQKIESISNGFRVSSHVEGWYYLPFYPQKPPTSDWWAMDNPNTRKRIYNVCLDTVVEACMDETGINISICATGYSGIPFRAELGFLPCKVRHQCFVMDGNAGQAIVLTQGMLEITGDEGDILTIEGGFAEHASLIRRDTAYLQSPKHFTVYLTAYTPVKKTFRIGTKGFEKKDLLPWEA